MSSRRTDQRRRRVLMEEVAQSPVDTESDSTGSPEVPPRAKKAPRRAYSKKAERRHQLKTTDLIPKRLLSWLVLSAGLVLALGLLNLAYYFLQPLQISGSPTDVTRPESVPVGSELTGKSSVSISASNVGEAVSLTGRSGFAAWYSSLLLILSSLASLQIYALRQHRRNDYRGTYRVWLWFAAILMVSSLNCIVDLHHLCSQCLQYWTQSFSWTGSGSGPSIIKMSLLAVIVVRGLIEIRVSPTSFVLVCFVWLAYSATLLLQIPSLAVYAVHEHQVEVAQGNVWLIGVTLTLVATLYYARVVFLHASGLAKLPVPKPSSVRRSKSANRRVIKKRKSPTHVQERASQGPAELDEDAISADEEIAAHSTKTQSNTPLGKLVANRRVAEAAPVRETARRQDAERLSTSERDEEVPSRLSKAERRRLKKEKRRAA
ncbi:MAG TPA: hypothetical protein PKD54_02750 [Pirellulaceae bacterium]|nr:hypothetical protein [Pirellulaceae bacterium]